jgi:hypothetical protein
MILFLTILSTIQTCVLVGAAGYIYINRKKIDEAVGIYVGSMACFAGDMAAENFHEKMVELADEAIEQEILQEQEELGLSVGKPKTEVN